MFARKRHQQYDVRYTACQFTNFHLLLGQDLASGAEIDLGIGGINQVHYIPPRLTRRRPPDGCQTMHLYKQKSCSAKADT